MRPILMVMAVLALASCGQDAATDLQGGPAKSPDRYSGIGTFPTDRLWKQLANPPAVNDPKAASVADDEQIIVVIDGHTGEVRQCGDHSGVCVAMNPWSSSASPIAAPMKLTKNAADLDAEAAAELTEPKARPTQAHR